MQSAELQTHLKTMGVLAVTSVVLFILSILIAKQTAQFLPKYKAGNGWIRNFAQLCICIIIMTLIGYMIRQVPLHIPLPHKSSNFEPKSVKEIKGTILVGPAFMFFFSDVLKPYIALF